MCFLLSYLDLCTVNPHITHKSLVHVSIGGRLTVSYQIFIECLIFAGHCAELIQKFLFFKAVAFWLICAGKATAKKVEEIGAHETANDRALVGTWSCIHSLRSSGPEGIGDR